jgi:hypothetical protein
MELDQLCSMFSDLSRDVIDSILQVNQGDVISSMEVLLELQKEAANAKTGAGSGFASDQYEKAAKSLPLDQNAPPCQFPGCKTPATFSCPSCDEAHLKAFTVCGQAHFEKLWTKDHSEFHKKFQHKPQPPPQQPPAINYSGYLMKTAQHDSLIGKKKKRQRWFVLKNHVLQYYENNQSLTEPIKGLRLDMSDCRINIPNRSEMCFMLTISSLAPSDENRVFVLNASSEHEMDAWVQNLREAANFLDRRRNYDREVAARRIESQIPLPMPKLNKIATANVSSNASSSVPGGPSLAPKIPSKKWQPMSQ